MSDHIQHHGIKGQQWGKRNGPPYPLDYSDLSPEEKRKSTSRVGGAVAGYKLTYLDRKKSMNELKRDRLRGDLKSHRRAMAAGSPFASKRREARLERKIQKKSNTIRHTKEKIDNTILKLESKGYSIYSKDITRLLTTGAEYALGGGAGGILGLTITQAINAGTGRSIRMGKAYKVKAYRPESEGTSKRDWGTRKDQPYPYSRRRR